MKRAIIFVAAFLVAAGTTGGKRFIPWKTAAGGGGGGGPLVAHTVQNLASGSQTTTGIDTTGANLIVIAASSYLSENTPTDNKGNTYTGLTYDDGSGTMRLRLYYCASASVGSGHTFTTTSTFGTDVLVLAFSGMSASQIDQQTASNASSGTSVAAGSITTGQANTVVVSVAGHWASGTTSISDGMTIVDDNGQLASAYKVLTATATINPTWSNTTSQSEFDAKVVSFKY